MICGMMMYHKLKRTDMNNEIEAYRKHRNLKLAAKELNIPWQTLYVHLKKANEPVIGDKLRYGSHRDKIGAFGEAEFRRLVPFAIDRNSFAHQAKYDFDVLGLKVDVKAGNLRQLNQRYPHKSWSFSFKRQALICDFICCFCMGDDRSIVHVLLVPSELFKDLQTVSVTQTGASKWMDYKIEPEELVKFFSDLAS